MSLHGRNSHSTRDGSGPTTLIACRINNLLQHRLYPSSTMQQRRHPCFPNGFGNPTLQPQVRERNPVANNTNPNRFPVSSRSPSLSQPPRNPVAANNTTLNVSSLIPGSSVSTPQPVASPKTLQPKRIRGLDESADKRTIWYLGQLEQPRIIDLESHDGKDDDLDLTLKL